MDVCGCYVGGAIGGAADYILKSEDLNDAIRASADGTDDEEVSYYISLMRSLSMRLNPSTIEFFYNEVHSRDRSGVVCLPSLLLALACACLCVCVADTSLGAVGKIAETRDAAVHRVGQIFCAQRIDGSHRCSHTDPQHFSRYAPSCVLSVPVCVVGGSRMWGLGCVQWRRARCWSIWGRPRSPILPRSIARWAACAIACRT